MCRLYGFMRRLALALLCVFVLAGSLCAEEAGQAKRELRIIVAANGKNLYATLDDNPASRALYELLPITVNMRNLYGREMCYNLPGVLKTGQLVAGNYKVGDIIYWPPRQSLVILYKQNNERFRRQHLGHIDSGVEMFSKLDNILVTFAPYEEPEDAKQQ